MQWAKCRHHDDDGDISPAPNGNGGRMKRNLLAVGLLSLCLLGISASQAFAGIFDCCCWCRHKYTTQITCRPYNAFTPICWGNLCCDGCCPNPCGVAGGCLPVTMGTPPFPANGCGCGPMMGGGFPMPFMGGSEGCCASDMGPMMAGPSMMPRPMPYPQQMPMPQDNRNPGFQGPMPMPVGPNTTMMYPQNFGVSQAAYQQPYYPMPYPNYYMPTNYYPYAGWQQPMPYYWYGGR
jgi:hypothetical protein